MDLANEEKYIFNVDADTNKAVNKLQEITKMMNTIDKIHSKGVDNYFTTSQKDMDKNMRTMAKLTRSYREVDRELSKIQRKLRDQQGSMGIPQGASKEQIAEISKMKSAVEDQVNAAVAAQKRLQREYDLSLAKYRKMATFQQNYSKDFKSIFSSKDIFNMPAGEDNFARARKAMQELTKEADEVTSKVTNVRDKIQEVNKLDRRSESVSRRGAASNYLSYQQASSFTKDYNTTRNQYHQERETNMDRLTRLGQERKSLSEQVEHIERNPSASGKDIDRKIEMQQSIQAIDEEMDQRRELSRVLERTIKNMEEYNKRLTANGGVEVKPERGTTRGMMYERAPAIALAVTGATALTVGGLYSQGASLNKSMRDDVIGMGQHTGTAGADWREAIRDNALDSGVQNRLGFTGQEMLAFQNNYLSATGFNGMDDLTAAGTNQAMFSRSTGIDAATTQDFFKSVFQSGAVSGLQVKDIQNGFIGAIKQSGMEGREKEQLKALQGVLENVSRGRTLENQDVMNVLGMQSLLAGSGVRSLTGTDGGELLSGLDQGIRQAYNDGQMRLIFGQGTKYQGLSGSFALREQMDKGVSDPDNVATLGNFAMGYGNDEATQNEVFARLVSEKMGVPITAEQAEGLMNLHRQGALTGENVRSIIETDKASSDADSKYQEYLNSHESIDNQSDATTAKQATELYDMGEAIRSVNGSLAGMNAVAYAAVAALGSLAVAAMGTAASFGGASVLRNGMSGRFGQAGSNAWNKVKGWFGRGGGRGGRGGGSGPSGGAPSGIAAGADTASDVARAAGTASAGAGAVEGAASGASGGLLRGAGSLLGKIALPVGVIAGIGSVMSAPEGEKAKAFGGAAGGILGGMGAGALSGAALGSVFPGVGTVIGGIGGGVLGGIAGSGVGRWIGGKFGGSGDSATVDAPAVEGTETTSQSAVKQQTDKENTNTHLQAENKRSDNVAQERENLKIFETMLNRAESILYQARQQNGIFGSATSNGASGSVAASPLSGNNNAEKIWNFFASKGFSDSAISGILGNLQQESGLDPTATNSSSGAFGIGQWLGGRKTGLQNYAKENGLDVNSLDTQLQYMWKEMNGGEATFSSVLKKYGGMDALKSANVSDATEMFEKAFERSGGSAMGKRQDYAQDFYDKYGGTQMSRSSVSKSSSSSNSMDVKFTTTVKVEGDEKVSDKIRDKKDLEVVGKTIQNRIYGSLNLFSQEMRRY